MTLSVIQNDPTSILALPHTFMIYILMMMSSETWVLWLWGPFGIFEDNLVLSVVCVSD